MYTYIKYTYMYISNNQTNNAIYTFIYTYTYIYIYIYIYIYMYINILYMQTIYIESIQEKINFFVFVKNF